MFSPSSALMASFNDIRAGLTKGFGRSLVVVVAAGRDGTLSHRQRPVQCSGLARIVLMHRQVVVMETRLVAMMGEI